MINRIQQIHPGYKQFIKLLYDGLAVWFAFILSYNLRFNFGVIPQKYQNSLNYHSVIVIIIVLLFLFVFKVYRGVWHYASLTDLLAISVGLFSGTVIAALLDFYIILPNDNSPRSVYIIFALTAYIFLGAGRLTYRLFAEKSRFEGSNGKRTVLVGLSENCVSMMKALQFSNRQDNIVGIINVNDDNDNRRILGRSFMGGIEELPETITKKKIEQVLIINHDESGELVRRVVSAIENTEVLLKIVPSIDGIMENKHLKDSVRNVRVEDLLNRSAVNLELDVVRDLLRDSRVMITGAGGSIGSELCRQVFACEPERLILVDNSEFMLYQIDTALSDAKGPACHVSYLRDVCDVTSMREIIAREKPRVIFHAAAFKHVPLMESNARQAVLNNVGGTLNMIERSLEGNVEKFVLISTDKAVNPCNVMGATKRISELLCQAANTEGKSTRFAIVRFGNVLASNGSVVPRFIAQIEKGGPVTITHPEITRYFMSIEEASRLVLKASAIAQGGEIFVLDMGEPLKIIDLARALIRFSGHVPDRDIKIKITGLRPGEKITEELFYENDHLEPTGLERIMVAIADRVSPSILSEQGQFLARLDQENVADIRAEIKRFIPEFSYKEI